MRRDPYEILGITRDATLREASAAYRRMAELYHPDRLRDYRREVREEGSRRLKEANAAIRVLRAKLRGPLVAAGHEPPRGADRSANANGRRSGGSATPVAARGESPIPPSPSDAATAAGARVYYVDVHSVDGPDLHVRWEGEHAAATLCALKKGHRLDGGPIKQVEWGTYTALLQGDAARRLVEGVLPHDDNWRDHPANLVTLDATGDHLPVRLNQQPGEMIPLAAVIDLLDPATWYEVLADAY